MDAFIKSVNTQGAQHLANQQHLEKRLNEIDNRAKAIQATQNSIQDAVNSLGELNDTHAVKLEAHRERISEVETWVKQVKDAMHTGEDAGDLLSREEIYAAFDEKIQKQANKDADARYEKHIRGLLEIQAKRIAALEAFVDKDLPVQVTSEIGNALDVPDQELKRIDQCLDQHMDHIRALQKQVNTAARELQQIRQSVPADSKATAEKIKRIQARLRKLEAIRTKKGN